jgi:hypothetical protein
VGWWWVDNDNRVYRFAEWYGWDGKTPNKGLRLTDQDIAVGILEREQAMKLQGRKITRIAGKDCFQKRPNYMGGGQGPGTAENFKAFAESEIARSKFGPDVDLTLIPGDPSRELKIRQFRNRLRVPNNPSELPMLVIYPHCTHFKRTIPALCLEDITGEDLDDGQEDHCYDEACHICMARPIGTSDDAINLVIARQNIARTVDNLDHGSRVAAADFAAIRRRLASEQSEDGITTEILRRDPGLDPRVYGLDAEAFDEIWDTGIKIG